MNENTRIQLTDSMMGLVSKMTEGNPGAISALMQIMAASAKVDPQAALGHLAPALSLDTHGIYGSDIYVLFSDKCEREPRKVLVLLRAVQLGIMQESRLKQLAADQLRQVELSESEFLELDNAVCERLEEFQKAA